MLDTLLPLLGVIGGLGALIFAALRFNRDDAEKVVGMMRALNDEVVQALDRCRAERVALEDTRRELQRQIKLKDAEIRSLQARLRKARP